MEDRTSDGLYLEMTDRTPARYASERTAEVADIDGPSAPSIWRNVHRDRSDLPRVLDEFDTLAVYEVGAAFVAPTTLPDEIRSLHFMRTPRPGQGTLSGRATIGLSLVLISPRDEATAQDLRDWGDFVHIRHIAEAAVPGFTMITPYVNADRTAHPRFMHFYEMDCPDPERAFKAMTPLVTQRIGPRESVEWKQWATCPSLRIMYVNTFERVG